MHKGQSNTDDEDTQGFTNVYEAIQASVAKETKKAQEIRARILGVNPEEVRVMEYEFSLPANMHFPEYSERSIIMALQRLGQEKYGDYEEMFHVRDTDTEIRSFDGIWSSIRLMWPISSLGYIESIMLYRDCQAGDYREPAQVVVWLAKGKQNARQARATEQEARQIFEEVKKRIEIYAVPPSKPQGSSKFHDKNKYIFATDN